MEKYFIFLFIFCLLFNARILSQDTTITFANKDAERLKMDIYQPDLSGKAPCIIFAFGGGFKGGQRHTPTIENYCRYFNKKGMVAVSIDYRLGLKNVDKVGPLRVAPLRNAINLAVEDLYSAVNYLLQHAEELNIDTSKIILSGSSAGAIAALQADYELSRRSAIASELPLKFKFAGVVAFAGAILSFEGVPEYKAHPSPTLFFHGTTDQVVPYDKIKVLNRGFFGSGALAEIFRKEGYAYHIYRFQGMGHEVATLPMKENLDEVYSFLKKTVFEKMKIQEDETIN